MSALSDHAQEYLRARRALGVKLERHGRLLPQLVDYLGAAGATTVTRELAISWAKLPARAHPQHWAARLSIARGFAAYLHTIDPTTEVPPAGVFAVRYQRPTPYLWSRDDIGRLLEATRGLRPPLKAASYEALFGLLAVSGMRLGEAIALEPGDVDLERGLITIRTQTAKLERAPAGPAAPDHGAGTRALLQNPGTVMPQAEIENVLSLQHRHQPESQRGRKDSALTDHRARSADRHHPPDRAPTQTQLRCRHADRLAALRGCGRRADRGALDLSGARRSS